MTRVTDVRADVVKERRKFEPFALLVGETVNVPRLIEDREREPRDLIRVLRQVAAPLGQLDHAPQPHIWVPIRLCDVFPVALDVIEDETFAERQVAQRDFGGVQMPHD